MRTAVLGGALLGVAFAALVFAMRVFGGPTAPPKSTGDWIGEIAFFAVYAAPPAVAVLALRGRRGALLAASALSALLSWTAFSGITLVLLVPAAVYAMAYVASHQRNAVSSALWSLVPVLAGYAAFWALFAVDNPYCWEYVVRPDGTTTFATVSEQEAMSGPTLGPYAGEAGGGCDDRVTPLESVASLALVALAVTAAVLPRRGRRAQTAAG